MVVRELLQPEPAVSVLLTLPTGWTFVREPDPARRFSGYENLSGFRQHFFYGRFTITTENESTYTYDVYVRYYAERIKRDSAIGLISVNGMVGHRWLYAAHGDSTRQPEYVVEQLIRQGFLAEAWWFHLQQGNNAEQLR